MPKILIADDNRQIIPVLSDYAEKIRTIWGVDYKFEGKSDV